MEPAAPVTFSTRKFWPSVVRIRSPMMRASASDGPPAANGTMMVIGLFGYVCAAALATPAMQRNGNRQNSHDCYSGLMLAASMMGRHLSISALRKARSACGVC